MSRNSGGTAIYWSEARSKYMSSYLYVQRQSLVSGLDDATRSSRSNLHRSLIRPHVQPAPSNKPVCLVTRSG